MNSLVLLLSLFGSCFCQHWGYHQQVQDTPEVASAKAAHFAAHAKAHQTAQEHSWQAQDRSWPDDGSYKVVDDGSYKEDDGSWKDDSGSWKEDTGSWKGIERSSVVPSHSWAPQPQWQSHEHHDHQQSHWQSTQKKWTGPVALPPGYDKHGAPLPVLDTPEVAAEKAKHFHLYAHGAHAAAAASHHGGPSY